MWLLLLDIPGISPVVFEPNGEIKKIDEIAIASPSSLVAIQVNIFSIFQ